MSDEGSLTMLQAKEMGGLTGDLFRELERLTGNGERGDALRARKVELYRLLHALENYVTRWRIDE